jgi:hypothetical protein
VAGVPIDQLLHSARLTVLDRRTGVAHGGTHRSLIVTLARAAE